MSLKKVRVAILIVSVLLIVGSGVAKSLLPRLWIRQSIEWYGLTIRVDTAFSIVGANNGVTLARLESKGPGSDDGDHLVFLSPSERRSRTFERWRQWCSRESDRCGIHEDSIGMVRIECIEIDGPLAGLGQQDFHTRCRVSPVDIEVGYNGARESYPGFYSILVATLKTYREK
jgi:hypothetical protein